MTQYQLVVYITLSYLVMCFQSGVEGISITSIRVPPAVENGSAPVVLDCEYTLSAHEKQGLVVQWFFRDHIVPVYQWIPGKRPQDNGPLKGRLNLEYRASEDPYHRHRALEIIRPSTDLGGDYRCKVATFDNEDIQSAHMVVYVPATSFTVGKTKPTISTINVTCKVEGIYPEPHLELIQEDGPHGSSRITIKEATLSVTSHDGRYDATLHRVLEDQHLTSETVFECLLSLPATEYQTSQKMSYLPGVSLAGAMASPGNDIDEDKLLTQMGSGGGTSTSSVSPAPHRSLDSIVSPLGKQSLHEASESTDSWQSGTGRGIRAHDIIADSGATYFSRPRIPGLLMAIIVAKYFS